MAFSSAQEETTTTATGMGPCRPHGRRGGHGGPRGRGPPPPPPTQNDGDSTPGKLIIFFIFSFELFLISSWFLIYRG